MENYQEDTSRVGGFSLNWLIKILTKPRLIKGMEEWEGPGTKVKA